MQQIAVELPEYEKYSHRFWHSVNLIKISKTLADELPLAYLLNGIGLTQV